MDKFTILREDIESLTEAGLTDQEIGVTLLAMVRYGMDGAEPDFDAPGPRIAFAMLKKRMDKYIRKCETNAANGQSGGRPPKPTENPTETQNNPTETQPIANETYDYDYEQEYDEAETVTPGADETHTTTQPGGRRARAREGWFDPEHPDEGDDRAWSRSTEARKATANRIMAWILDDQPTPLIIRRSVTDAGVLGLSAGLFDALMNAMENGVSPCECVHLAERCRCTWEWELLLMARVINEPGADYPPEWREKVDELQPELAALLVPGVMAG